MSLAAGVDLKQVSVKAMTQPAAIRLADPAAHERRPLVYPLNTWNASRTYFQWVQQGPRLGPFGPS
jgi:hypothetical protein